MVKTTENIENPREGLGIGFDENLTPQNHKESGGEVKRQEAPSKAAKAAERSAAAEGGTLDLNQVREKTEGVIEETGLTGGVTEEQRIENLAALISSSKEVKDPSELNDEVYP